MNDSPIDRLTERQRQLLELVNNEISRSKDISRETGLVPGSIDTLLQNAAKILGVRDRKSAAQRYAELLQNSQETSQLRSPNFETKRKSGLLSIAGALERTARSIARFFRGPPFGGSEQHLRWDQVLLQVLRVAVIGMVAIWALVLFVLGFFRTFG